MTTAGEALTPEQRKALAEAQKAETEAAKAAWDLEQAKVKALVPDLAAGKPGETTAPETGTVLSSLLAAEAVQAAASELMKVVKSRLADDYRLLVTSDSSILQFAAEHTALADRLQLFRDEIRSYHADENRKFAVAPGLVAAAVQLLPGLLTLLSARRTLTTGAGEVDDEVAKFAVAGAVAAADAEALVCLDIARTVSGTRTQQVYSDLVSDVDELATALSEETDPERLKKGTAILQECQAALKVVVTIPEKETLSPLTRAALAEDLVSGGTFDALLIVHGGATSTTQLIDDRPLRFGDPISVITSATMSYALVDLRPGNSLRVVRAGVVSGTKQMHGKIGTEIELF